MVAKKIEAPAISGAIRENLSIFCPYNAAITGSRSEAQAVRRR